MGARNTKDQKDAGEKRTSVYLLIIPSCVGQQSIDKPDRSEQQAALKEIKRGERFPRNPGKIFSEVNSKNITESIIEPCHKGLRERCPEALVQKRLICSLVSASGT